MNLQYISDSSGQTKAVQLQIPIEDWNLLKKKYKEFEEEELAANVSEPIPEWQIELGMRELNDIAEGNTELVEWSEAKKQFKL